jgi:hypothetical protein
MKSRFGPDTALHCCHLQFEFSNSLGARSRGQNRIRAQGGNLIIGSAIQIPARLTFANAAPLFKKKWNFGFNASILDGSDPFLSHRASAISALPANDDPGNTSNIQCTEILQKRFDREEPNSGGSVLQMLYSGESVTTILDADAPPNVALQRELAKCLVEHCAQPL